MPESTRWLISHRRYDEAHKQIVEACHLSGKEMLNLHLVPVSLNGSVATISTLVVRQSSTTYNSCTQLLFIFLTCAFSRKMQRLRVLMGGQSLWHLLITK